MGRRSHKAKFAPGVYVFPGGNLEQADRKLKVDTVMDIKGLPASQVRNIQALALAAIRETWEETGLLLGTKGELEDYPHPAWAKFKELGLVPAPQLLSYLGRAITPAQSRARFHARFFVTDAKNCSGELASSGELSDLRWVGPSEQKELPMYDVTEFMIKQLSRQQGKLPLLSYRSGKSLIRYE